VRTTRRAAVLLALVVACLLAVTACSVPGGYNVAGLNKEPAAALTYPGSTDVQPWHFDGIRGNWASKGGPAGVDSHGKMGSMPRQSGWHDYPQDRSRLRRRGAAMWRSDATRTCLAGLVAVRQRHDMRLRPGRIRGSGRPVAGIRERPQ
jgi:hypothetical protein